MAENSSFVFFQFAGQYHLNKGFPAEDFPMSPCATP
jgi:hypothetical protein